MANHVLWNRLEEQAQHRRDDAPWNQAEETPSASVPKGILNDGTGIVGQGQDVLDAVERTAKEVCDFTFLFGCESVRGYDERGDVGFDFGVENRRELGETDCSTSSSEEEVHGHDSGDPAKWLAEPSLQGQWSESQTDANTGEKQIAVKLPLLVVVDRSGQEANSNRDNETTEDGRILGLFKNLDHS